MKKVEIVAGSCIALLAAVSIGQLYLDKQEIKPSPAVKQDVPAQTAQAEIKPVTVDEVIETYLPSVTEGTDVGRQVALGSLIDELEGPEYGKAEMKPESAEAFAKAAVAVAETTGEGAPSEELKGRVAGFLAARTHDQTSREFVLKSLENGSSVLREAALDGLMNPRAMTGRRIFEKVADLGTKGLINSRQLPGLLRRTGGKKATLPIVSIMKSTDDAKVISACVIALQDIGDPAVLGPSLERLEATGMIDKPKSLPWLSAALFSKHMETAEGSALARGIKAMRTRPSLVKQNLDAVAKGLEKGDPETRRAAAEAVKKAVVGKIIDAQHGEQMLAGRLVLETEPVLKAELTGGLEQVRGLMETPKPQATQQ